MLARDEEALLKKHLPAWKQAMGRGFIRVLTCFS